MNTTATRRFSMSDRPQAAGEVPTVRIVSSLLYAAAGTAIALIVLVFVLRLAQRHGGPVAPVAAQVSNLTGLNA